MSAIALAAILIIGYFLSQLPFSLWLPGYTLLPEWLHERSLLTLIMANYFFVLIPAILLGTPIFYYRVLKKS